MAEEKKKMSVGQSIFTLIAFAVGVWYFWGGGWEHATNKTMTDIQNKVAQDMADQYDIAKRNGNRVDVCVHAGIVKAGYLQAKDEANFQKWNAIEASDCAYMGRR